MSEERLPFQFPGEIGDPEPSREDVVTTRRLVEASAIVGIPLIDHLVLGRDSYVSLRVSGQVLRLFQREELNHDSVWLPEKAV